MDAATQKENQPRIIRLNDEELASKSIGSHSLQAALEALNEDGLVVLENAVDPAHLDKLNERMVADAEKLRHLKEIHFNFGRDTNNIQQGPVADEGYVFDDVIANPWAASILEHMVGPKPRVRLYSANTAFNAKARQPVHIDIDGFPHTPHGYCVNINLVSVSPQNGATEFWLGTHNDRRCNLLAINGTDDDDPDPAVVKQKRAKRAEALGLSEVSVDFTDALIEERRKIRPPVQASLPRGSVIIRDIRLWHAGMPNHTNDPRIMLVTIVFANWYRSNQRLILPERWKGKIDWGLFDPCVEWVDNDRDYLQGAHNFDLSQLP